MYLKKNKGRGKTGLAKGLRRKRTAGRERGRRLQREDALLEGKEKGKEKKQVSVGK